MSHTESPKQKVARILYTLAEQADRRFYAVCRARTGKDCWSMNAAEHALPEVREALRDKLNAGEAWLTFLRTTR